MNDGKIHLSCKKIRPISEQGVIKLTSEAYNLLADIVNESNGLSLKRTASKIIVDAVEKDLIVFDREE